MRYTPFEAMDRLFEQLRREMNDGDWTWDVDGLGTDLTRREDEYVFTAGLPGFDREEIDLRFDDGHLVLSATHEADDETVSRHRSVSRRIAVPGEVTVEEISASYHNGVLEVHLPLEEDVETGHEIDVE